MVLHSSDILYGNAYAFIMLEYPAFHLIDFNILLLLSFTMSFVILLFFPLFLKVISPKLCFHWLFFSRPQKHFNFTLFSRWKSSTDYIHKDCTTHLSNITELSNVLLPCNQRFFSSLELYTHWKMYITFMFI